jgi:hypothetical protein
MADAAVADNAGSFKLSDLKWVFTFVAFPLGMEFFSELAFTFTDFGSEWLNAAADFFGLEGGIHGGGHEHDAASHAGELFPGDEGYDDCVMNGGSLLPHGNVDACTPE